MISLLRVYKMKINKYKIDEYVIANLYFSKTNSNRNKNFVYLQKKYIINDFRIKMLINNDIIDFENIFIDIIYKTIYINNCKITINISIRLYNEFIKRKFYIKSIVLISSYNNAVFSIKSIDLFNNRGFLFESFI